MASDSTSKITLDLIFKVILNACGPLGLGATLLGWIKPLGGFAFMGIGFAYIIWEFRQYIKSFVRVRPKMSLVTFLLCGALAGAVCWLAIKKSEIKEATPTNPVKDTSPSKPLLPTLRPPNTEQQEIVETLVDKFKKSHKGQSPTYDWINKRLKKDGRGFQVGPVESQPATDAQFTFHGGSISGNDIGIWNEDPNAKYSFDGTKIDNNKAAIINSQATPKPPQKP